MGNGAGPVPQSTAELVSQQPREFIILIGKDGSGKSCATVSVARWVQMVLNPEATFYVIDTENKFPAALRSFGDDAPTNISYFKTDTMNEATDAAEYIMAHRKMGDWLAVESMARVWERAQDMGYKAITGFDKIGYLEARKAKMKATGGNITVTPRPDDFWSIVKGAHDGAFLDMFSNAHGLNCILTSTIAKPPKADGRFKENEQRKEIRAEFGIDVGIDGAPRVPYYAETLAMLTIDNGAVVCRVLRDNHSRADDSRVTFKAGGKKDWASNFWMTCR